MEYTLGYISKILNGKLGKTTNPNRKVIGFYSDSRIDDEARLFLALRGERVDGNDFVASVLQKNGCAITDKEENLSLDGDLVCVSDVRAALQELARHYRYTEITYMPIVGITGSVGKTTTKDMVALALSSERKVHKTQGNSNSQIGLPQTVLATPTDADCAVVELGMSMPGEMEKIAYSAAPSFSIITNIGYSHIENLGSREAILEEKLKIASYSGETSYLIVNGDEPLLRNHDYQKNSVYFVSFNDETCNCYAKNITENENSVSFTAVIANKEVDVQLNVRGKHFVQNALFALNAAYFLDVDLKKAADALSTYESDGKRQFIYQKDGHTIISDCYNASPESMEASLSVLKTSKGRRIAVLGDMLELGNESISLHKRVGDAVTKSADVLVTFGEMAKYIAEAAIGVEAYSFEKEDLEKLKQFLETLVREGDTILYKASNGMNLGRVIV